MQYPGSAISIDECAFPVRDSGLLSNRGICAGCIKSLQLLAISDATSCPACSPSLIDVGIPCKMNFDNLNFTRISTKGTLSSVRAASISSLYSMTLNEGVTNLYSRTKLFFEVCLAARRWQSVSWIFELIFRLISVGVKGDGLQISMMICRLSLVQSGLKRGSGLGLVLDFFLSTIWKYDVSVTFAILA